MTTTASTPTALAPIGRVYRVAALAEGVSWLGLLIGMFFKYVVQDDPHSGIEGGVPVLGAVHGALFVAYIVITVIAARKLRWSVVATLLALGASIPPLFTWWFEAVAKRKGMLQAPEAR